MDGYESIKFMKDIQSERELEELGIVLKGHKRRIWAEIQKLRMSKEMDRMKQEDEEKMMMEEVSEPESQSPSKSKSRMSTPGMTRPSVFGFNLSDSTRDVITGYTDNGHNTTTTITTTGGGGGGGNTSNNHLSPNNLTPGSTSSTSTRGGHHQWDSV